MLGWVGNVEQETLDNETFRTVVFTGDHTQLTVMSLKPGRGHRARAPRRDRPVPPHRAGQRARRARPFRGLDRRDARRRGRLGDHRPGRRLAQRRQHRGRRAEALLPLLAARAPGRHRAPDEGGGRGGRGRPARLGGKGSVTATGPRAPRAEAGTTAAARSPRRRRGPALRRSAGGPRSPRRSARPPRDVRRAADSSAERRSRPGRAPSPYEKPASVKGGRRGRSRWCQRPDRGSKR